MNSPAPLPCSHWPHRCASLALPTTLHPTQSFKSDPVIVTPSLNHLDVQPSDEFVVLATDGLWDVMEPSDVMRWARNKFKQGKGAQEVSVLGWQE